MLTLKEVTEGDETVQWEGDVDDAVQCINSVSDKIGLLIINGLKAMH